MSQLKVLVVDDNASVLEMMQQSLEHHDFEVVVASNVTEALSQIVVRHFDALITDLHMPDPGDGFAVVTAMRHAQPEAVTLVVSGFPDVQEAMAAILLQADEILVKPFEVKRLAELIRTKTLERKSFPKPARESVASILERDTALTIQRWLSRVSKVHELICIPLTQQQRTNHLTEIMLEIVLRLRSDRTMEVTARDSPSATEHGVLRHKQGYTAPLIVQESRILQVSIFETIQRNLAYVDFSLVLPDVMLIADEVDSQLTQCISSYLKAQALAA